MEFRNINNFNVIINSLSGNFFPLTGEKIHLGFGYSVYTIFTWLFDIAYIFSTMIGLLLNCTTIEVIQKGGPIGATCLEMIIVLIYLNSQREHLHNLIHRINNILIDSDILEKCIRDTIGPYKKFLKFYVISSVGVIAVWVGMPIVKIFKKDEYTAMDYTLPSYVPGSPVTTRFFVLYLCIQIIGGSFNIFKKLSVEVYMTYFITVMTAEYRYVRERIVAAFDEKDDKSVIEALKICIEHHCNTIETGNMLINLSAFNIGVTYVACVFKFCFLAYTTITISGSYFLKFLSVSFMSGSVVQVYLLCSCTQELLEASTSVFDDAFYEDWYQRGSSVKNMFHTIGISNRMECRLNAFSIVDLTVPTFATILNKAYSTCLFLLNI